MGEKIVARIKWWEDYTARNKGEMNNNPSPGNKAGGLTTILEKSLGAAAKGGSVAVNPGPSAGRLHRVTSAAGRTVLRHVDADQHVPR